MGLLENARLRLLRLLLFDFDVFEFIAIGKAPIQCGWSSLTGTIRFVHRLAVGCSTDTMPKQLRERSAQSAYVSDMMTISMEESPEGMVEKARAAGFSINEDQISGWHGLIPRPRQQWTQGVAGSQTIYPIGSGDQLCALCAVREENRSSALIWGWKLWWLGFPVGDKYWRGKLKATAVLLDKSSRKFVRLLGSEQTDERYDDAVAALKNGRTRNMPFRQLRRRLGAAHFEGMLGLMLQILGGGFRGWSSSPNEDADALRDRMTVEKTFGFRRAKAVRELERNPTMHNDVEGVLHMLSRQLGGTKMTGVLKACSDKQIAEARMQLRVILFTVNGAEEKSGLLVGYGVQVLKELARRMTPNDQAILLLYLLALNRNPDFKRELAVFLLALRRHVPKGISSAQIDYLRSQDPVICSFAFPT